jgi:hypothetical protein
MELKMIMSNVSTGFFIYLISAVIIGLNARFVYGGPDSLRDQDFVKKRLT